MIPRVRFLVALSVAVLVCGCYRSHERPREPVAPSVCPIPPVGSPDELVLLHDGPPARGLTIRGPGGAERLVTTDVGETPISLRVAPGGRYAVIHGIDLDDGRVIDLTTGRVDRLGALLPPHASEVCGSASSTSSPNGFTLAFRADGATFVYGCLRYAGRTVVDGGAWELDLETSRGREIVSDCARALVPRGTPCDLQVVFFECPGSDDPRAAVASELRRLSGDVRTMPGAAWPLSPGSYLALGDGPQSPLLLVDDTGAEQTLLPRVVRSSISVETALDGTAIVFDPIAGFGRLRDGSLQPLRAACAGEATPEFVGLAPSGRFYVESCSTARRTFVRDLDTDGLTEIPELAGSIPVARSWSATGERVLFQGDPAPSAEIGFVITPLEGGPSTLVRRRDPTLGVIRAVEFRHPAP